MAEFQHSIVLFTGDDGLPLEFNVRNTNEKTLLKTLIEHGGGLCSQNENAVHLISPGTKVLNADLGKKLVSSRYIFDCVKDNCLLNVNDYVFTISEARTSDISDEDSSHVINDKFLEVPKLNLHNRPQKTNVDDTDITVVPENDSTSNISRTVSSSKQNASQQSSNTSESFVEGSLDNNRKPKISVVLPPKNEVSCNFKPLTSTSKDFYSNSNENNFGNITDDLSPIQGSQSLVSPHKAYNVFSSEDLGINIRSQTVSSMHFTQGPQNPSVMHTVVTSSQPGREELDDFDNLLLSKAQKKHKSDDEDSLSQSYTVSSSADAQIGSKPTSCEIDSAELFGKGSAIPDSPAQNENLKNEYQEYIKKLEAEVEEILQKPSPKSIQDKICLVKYICCVRKLPPATVLESLQNLKTW